MTTTSTKIVIDVNDNSKGNLLSMSQAIQPDLDQCDSIYGLVLKNVPAFAGYEHNGFLPPLGSSAHSKSVRKLVVLDEKKVEQFVIDYHAETGDYEISLNNFTRTQLSKLEIEIHRINWNRVPRAINS